MQAGGDVEPGFQRRDDGRDPGGRDEAAVVRDADDERADAACRGLGRREVGQAQVDAAAGQPQLSRAELAAPLADAGGRLRGRDVRRVAEEEQVRTRDHVRALPPLDSLNENPVSVPQGRGGTHA